MKKRSRSSSAALTFFEWVAEKVENASRDVFLLRQPHNTSPFQAGWVGGAQNFWKVPASLQTCQALICLLQPPEVWHTRSPWSYIYASLILLFHTWHHNKPWLVSTCILTWSHSQSNPCSFSSVPVEYLHFQMLVSCILWCSEGVATFLCCIKTKQRKHQSHSNVK